MMVRGAAALLLAASGGAVGQVITVTQYPSVCSAVYTTGSRSITVVQSTVTVQPMQSPPADIPCSSERDALYNTGTPFVMELFSTYPYASPGDDSNVPYWLMPNGNTTTDRSRAAFYYINNGMLYSRDGSMSVSTNTGVDNMPFAFSTTPGSIRTTFVFANCTLLWNNAAFTNGTAQFYKLPIGLIDNAQILAKFIGPMEPERSWSPIAVRAAPAEYPVSSAASTSVSTSFMMSTMSPPAYSYSPVISSSSSSSVVAPPIYSPPAQYSPPALSSTSSSSSSSRVSVSTFSPPQYSPPLVFSVTPSSSSSTTSLPTILGPGTPIGPNNPVFSTTTSSSSSSAVLPPIYSVPVVTTTTTTTTSSSSSSAVLPPIYSAPPIYSVPDVTTTTTTSSSSQFDTTTTTTTTTSSSESLPAMISIVPPIYSIPDVTTTTTTTSSSQFGATTTTTTTTPPDVTTTTTTTSSSPIPTTTTTTTTTTSSSEIPSLPPLYPDVTTTTTTTSSSPLPTTTTTTSTTTTTTTSSSPIVSLPPVYPVVTTTTTTTSTTSSSAAVAPPLYPSDTTVPPPTPSYLCPGADGQALPDQYGTTYVIGCGKDAANAGAFARRIANTTWNECFEFCHSAVSTGRSGHCTGFTYNGYQTDTNGPGECFLKDDFSIGFVVGAESWVAAINYANYMPPAGNQPEPCPAGNNTQYTSDTGASYTIYCGLDIAPDAYNSNNNGTQTLTSCVNQCDADPTCRGTVYANFVCYFHTASTSLFTEGDAQAAVQNAGPGSNPIPAVSSGASSVTFNPTPTFFPVTTTTTTAADPGVTSVDSGPDDLPTATSAPASTTIALRLTSPTPVDMGVTGDLDVDDNFGGVNLNFDVTIYGQTGRTLWAGSNGFLSLGSGSQQYQVSPLPADTLPANTIVVFWDDLKELGNVTSPDQLQGVFYHNTTTSVTFEWIATISYDANSFYHFTCLIDSATPGVFVYNYYTVGTTDFDSSKNGATAVVGIQGVNAAGAQQAATYSYRTDGMVQPNQQVTCNTNTGACTSP